MLAFLVGTVSTKLTNPWRCQIEINGFGFEVFLSQLSWQQITPEQNTRLFTFLSLNPENPRIFGFAEEWELTFFRTLESIKGIGPKTALALLDGLSPDQLIQAVQDDNPNLLSKVPGIGSKTAERLIFELKPKIRSLNTQLQSQLSNTSFGGPLEHYQEISDVLISLGYGLAEIDLALKANHELLKIGGTQESLRACLSWLSQR